jgi:DNA-directed RNA polymerase subunit RPC12/RpoP
VPVHVYRCLQCRREILVREPGPLTPAEIKRRIEEETKPWRPGPPGSPHGSFRWRDDVWLGISAMRETGVPREELPDRCPACGRESTFERARLLE